MGCSKSKEDGETFATPSAAAPAKERQRRAAEIKARAASYAYAIDEPLPGVRLPPRPLKLPENETQNAHIAGQVWDLTTAKASLRLNRALDLVSNVFSAENAFTDWADLFRASTAAAPALFNNNRWRTDEEFGRQRVFGLHPLVVSQVRTGTVIDERIPVTDDMLGSELLPQSAPSIVQLLQAGRLFICDYAELEAAHADLAPVVLLAVDDQQHLIPLAIRLEAGAGSPVLTANPQHTSAGAWLCAKMHVQSADLLLHEVASHLAATHLIPEAIYLSAMRNLHATHPIAALLEAHFWGTSAVNFKGREVLVGGKDAVMPRLLSGGLEVTLALIGNRFASFHVLDSLNFPDFVAVRGLSSIAFNPFRDDALDHWRLILDFVTVVVSSSYPGGDKAISSDDELTAWCAEMRDVLKFQGIPEAGVPFTTETLALFLTGIIFNQTVMHTAVNGPQWAQAACVPSYPGRFRMDPPRDAKANFSDDDIAKCLPSFDDSCEQIALVSALAGKPSSDAALIGCYSEAFVAGFPVEVGAAAKKWRAGLSELGKKIDNRNKSCKDEFSYAFLHPDNVVNSVCM